MKQNTKSPWELLKVETKTKIGNLSVETKGKEKELLVWVEKNKYHKEEYEYDERLHTLDT